MVSNVDYTSPSAQFTFDVNTNNFFVKDNQNFINLLGINQLNTLENVSLLDIYLSKDNIIEPHYHQNAAELVYCISGAANVSLLNPYTKQIQNYSIKPGQVANVPHGWWHYEEALVDQTHLLAIFDAPTPEVILGSDILKLTPSNIMAKTYCLDEKQWKKATAPIQASTFIGPPKNCTKRIKNKSKQYVNGCDIPQYTIPSYYWYPYQNSVPYYYCRC